MTRLFRSFGFPPFVAAWLSRLVRRIRLLLFAAALAVGGLPAANRMILYVWWVFGVAAEDAALDGTTNPVPITLIIGNDGATTEVIAWFFPNN